MAAHSTSRRAESLTTKSRKSHDAVKRNRHHVRTAKVANSAEGKVLSPEELREARTAYYGQTLANRSGHSRPSAAKTRSIKTTSSRTPTHEPSTERGRRRRRRERSGRTENFVYPEKQKRGSERRDSAHNSLAGFEKSETPRRDEVHSSRRRHREDRDVKDRHSEQGSHGRQKSLDDPKAASNRLDARQARPPLRRSTTTAHTRPSSTLEVTSATDHDGLTSVDASRHSSTRTSSIFSTFFRSQSTPTVVKTKLVECLTCGADDIPSTKSARLECGHRMCHDCLKRIFTLSVTDPAHMPPKCCTAKHIPLKHVDALFTNKFKLNWNKKYQEYTCKNRLYCPRKGCGEWLSSPLQDSRSSPGRKYARCSKCHTKVCAKCNNKWHTSPQCPEDKETQAFIATAKEKGWQKCFNCSAMVELEEGCNHMTCRCTAEFCMLCGEKWKTCECPWFNYAGHVPEGDQLRFMRIPQIVEVLRRNVNDADGAQARREHVGRGVRDGHPEIGYQQEMDARRRQERMDEDLARRLQMAMDLEPDWNDEARAAMRGRMRQEQQQRMQHAQAQIQEDTAAPKPLVDVFGTGNAGTHFLNDDFINNAANVVLRALGDDAAAFGRRGER